MPYFNKANLLFVHIPKNAGRSIELAFEKEKFLTSGFRSVANRAFTALARATSSGAVQERLHGSLDVTLSAQHLTYCEIAMLGLLKDVEDLNVFCVIRNPYDRILSSVCHFLDAPWKDAKNAKERVYGFEKDLEKWLSLPVTDHNVRAHKRNQIDFMLDPLGVNKMQYVLKFESLTEDFNRLCCDLNLDCTLDKRFGASGRVGTYRQYYNDHSRRLVEAYFARDLSAFDYGF